MLTNIKYILTYIKYINWIYYETKLVNVNNIYYYMIFYDLYSTAT